ncbi:unannotated protein [freshwater metagenome]|uniref:Unannotated protein n=1 Tax=freshwater metagenome TaxID=449393 RepID=A0A6J6NHR5_9ZZZZ
MMAANTKKAIDDAIRTVFACNRSPSALPTAIAKPSAITMPTVEPAHVPTSPSVVASVTVASIVLSPSSAKKKTVPTAMMMCFDETLVLSLSSSVNSSPRKVQIPKPTKAIAPTMLMSLVGSAVPIIPPRATEKRCTKPVANVIAISTGTVLYRVANARAMSWLLSPSSATKITPNDNRNACNIIC